jgi:hypothetical protein
MEDSKDNIKSTHNYLRSLLPYHKNKHQRATTILIDLFKKSNGGWFFCSEECQQLKDCLNIINDRIRSLNLEHGEDEGLGTIDYNTIAYGWEFNRSRRKPSAEMEEWQRQKLLDFCRRKQNPMGWSKIPPVHNHKYESYEPAYWKKEWDVFPPWLELIWVMRKQQFKKETIKDTETAMLKQKTLFNDKLREKNERFGANPFTHLLDLEMLLNVLRSMHRCLLEGQKPGSTRIREFEHREYEARRENLRQICELNGYPQSWIPTNFEVEGGA